MLYEIILNFYAYIKQQRVLIQEIRLVFCDTSMMKSKIVPIPELSSSFTQAFTWQAEGKPLAINLKKKTYSKKTFVILLPNCASTILIVKSYIINTIATTCKLKIECITTANTHFCLIFDTSLSVIELIAEINLMNYFVITKYSLTVLRTTFQAGLQKNLMN